MKIVTLKFTDPDDAARVVQCVKLAKAETGTLRPLYCGLLSSALRRCDSAEISEPKKGKVQS